MDLKERVKEVLEAGYLMSLATCDENGVWVSDVIFIFDEACTIYWMSDPDTRHSKAIATNGTVAATITVSGKNEPNLGIQITGSARRIDGARYDLAVQHMVKRGHPAPQETDDVLNGDSWFEVVPSKIRLIDEANFGFTAQDISL
jgi:uncharacterized protein YhbP (UPF0306 family)